MEKENIPFPNKIINSWDILRGLGSVAFHAIADQFRHESSSDHFVHPLDLPQEPVIDWPKLPFDSEGNWHNPDGDAA